MNSIFKYLDYKVYVNERLKALPKNGYGEFRRMAQALDVSTTFVSQIFSSEKHLGLEMAADLCDYLRLTDHESAYFLLLVENQKASTPNLKEKLRRRIVAEQKRENQLQSANPEKSEVAIEDRVTYYSHWSYAGVRHLCIIDGFANPQVLSERLGLGVFHVERILEFLVSRNLLLKQNDVYTFGAASIDEAARSPFQERHHHNWRLRALQKITTVDDQSLFFTGPMNMSEAVARRVREELPLMISKISEMVAPSEAEVARCLNIDFFEY